MLVTRTGYAEGELRGGVRERPSKEMFRRKRASQDHVRKNRHSRLALRTHLDACPKSDAGLTGLALSVEVGFSAGGQHGAQRAAPASASCRRTRRFFRQGAHYFGLCMPRFEACSGEQIISCGSFRFFHCASVAAAHWHMACSMEVRASEEQRRCEKQRVWKWYT